MHARLFSRCAAPALFAALAVVSAPAIAQPTFGNPSPTAGSDTSQRANQSADQALYSAKAAGRDRVFGTRVAGKRRRYGTHE